ncbi:MULTISPECIES: nuclear transport factor 2 family protein [unclassified Saccharicrinis]|uniref:nuclear transport factor 2 family protein n=1 Tax=unclassified Saccharicrinis TaxID=2646859 RepID=UPI003D32FCD1
MNTKEVMKSQQKKDVALVLDSLLLSQEKGDFALFSSCFANQEDVVHIGTDLDEYWESRSNFMNHMKHMVDRRKGLKIMSDNTRIQISDIGDTAWYTQLIDTSIETKGDPFRLEGFRHSGVMVKNNGEWKIVQSHISVALDHPGDELPG